MSESENNGGGQKIAVIGSSDSVIGFLAVGFSVYDVKTAAEARSVLAEIAAECAVIFICDDFACLLGPEIAAYKSSPTPAIIPIPSKAGSNGYGMAQITEAVVKAVGANI